MRTDSYSNLPGFSSEAIFFFFETASEGLLVGVLAGVALDGIDPVDIGVT